MLLNKKIFLFIAIMFSNFCFAQDVNQNNHTYSRLALNFPNIEQAYLFKNLSKLNFQINNRDLLLEAEPNEFTRDQILIYLNTYADDGLIIDYTNDYFFNMQRCLEVVMHFESALSLSISVPFKGA